MKYYERLLTVPHIKFVMLIIIMKLGDLPRNHLQQY
jgi:hypothetical protein